MINQFIVIASSTSPYIEGKIRRNCFIIYILTLLLTLCGLASRVILKTSITSPRKRLYFRVGKFKWDNLSLYGLFFSLIINFVALFFYVIKSNLNLALQKYTNTYRSHAVPFADKQPRHLVLNPTTEWMVHYWIPMPDYSPDLLCHLFDQPAIKRRKGGLILHGQPTPTRSVIRYCNIDHILLIKR